MAIPALQQHSGEHLADGNVRGSIIHAHMRWVRDYVSREQMIELFETLPTRTRRQVSMLLMSSWYPFATLIEVDRTIVALFGQGNSQILEQLGAYSADMDLAGPYAVLRPEGVSGFLRRASQLHREFQDFGSAAFEEDGAHAGTMVHSGYTSYSPLFCISADGFYRRSVTLHQVTDVQVTETECQCKGDPACRFRITWR